MDETCLKAVLEGYGLRLQKIRKDILLFGSPERSLWRTVAEDGSGRRFVVESIASSQRQRKEAIAFCLDRVYEKGLHEAVPYLKIAEDPSRHVLEVSGNLWLVSAFVDNDGLERPSFVYDSRKGEALAEFLVRLWTYPDHEKDDATSIHDDGFSLITYIYDLVELAKKRRADILPHLKDVLGYLESGFFEAYPHLPKRFSHGDFHPLNVLWGSGKDEAIRAVIDWEFCGMRPETYDMANLIGCVGIEDPNSLGCGLVCSFIHTIRNSGSISEQGWRWLPGLVIALRFAWLSEWLRKDDEEMISLEIEYMNLLVDKAGKGELFTA